jgi:hypothetical protein
VNRRSFLWQGVCSSLPFLAKTRFSQPVAAFQVSIPASSEFAAFARGLAGTVFYPGDSRYEKLRKGYAAKFNAHPALIVRPANPQDIASALSFARSHRLPLAVRCGGHSYAGYSSCEGGLVLDMSGFGNIVVANDKRTARVGGGVLSGALEKSAAQVGTAAVLGQCPSVGVGGFLLGGGISPIMSKFGLGCDNVLAATMVLADGHEVRASAHENPDLYWAIRGGGGNFGVVTEFELTLHPIPTVFGGTIVLESADPRVFLRALRDTIAAAPDELTLIALISAEPGHKPAIEIEACFVGEQSIGEKALAPLRHQPAVVHDTVRIRPTLDLEQLAPDEIPPSFEEHCNGFFKELDDRRIEILADTFATPPLAVDCFLIPLQGAVTRVPPAATAFPLRGKGIVFDVSAYWKPPSGQPAAKQWVETLKSRLPIEENGNYVNIMDRVNEESVRHAYGSNYARLQQIKARYDPHNLFSLNQNILPA